MQYINNFKNNFRVRLYQTFLIINVQQERINISEEYSFKNLQFWMLVGINFNIDVSNNFIQSHAAERYSKRSMNIWNVNLTSERVLTSFNHRLDKLKRNNLYYRYLIVQQNNKRENQRTAKENQRAYRISESAR